MLRCQHVLGLIDDKNVPPFVLDLTKRLNCALKKSLAEELFLLRVLRLETAEQPGAPDQLAIQGMTAPLC